MSGTDTGRDEVTTIIGMVFAGTAVAGTGVGLAITAVGAAGIGVGASGVATGGTGVGVEGVGVPVGVEEKLLGAIAVTGAALASQKGKHPHTASKAAKRTGTHDTDEYMLRTLMRCTYREELGTTTCGAHRGND